MHLAPTRRGGCVLLFALLLPLLTAWIAGAAGSPVTSAAAPLRAERGNGAPLPVLGEDIDPSSPGGAPVHSVPTGSSRLGEEVASGASSGAMVVSINASSDPGEVGLPVSLNASISGGVPPYFLTWYVDGNLTGPFWSNRTSLRLIPGNDSPLIVTLAVEDLYGSGGSTHLDLAIVVPPSVDSVEGNLSGEVGVPVLVGFGFSGGIGPYTITWTLVPFGGSGNLTSPRSGEVRLPILSDHPGTLVAQIALRDGSGGAASGTFDLGTIAIAPSVVLVGTPPTVESGVPFHLEFDLVGGVPPYRYWIVPSQDLQGSRNLSGTLDAPGIVEIDGTPRATGNLTVAVTTTDALGGTAQATTVVGIVTGLSLRIDLVGPNGSASPGWSALASVRGGVPPYLVSVRLGEGPARWTTVSSPGFLTMYLGSLADGNWTIDASVVDSVGGNASDVETWVVGPGTGSSTVPPAAPGTVGSDAGGAWVGPLLLGALFGGALVAGALWIRRRSGPKAPPPPSEVSARALDLVRRSLSTTGGMEVESLAVIAGDEGIDRDETRRAVAQWEGLGRVRKELDGSGAEVLYWTAAPAPVPPEDAGRGGPP